MTAFCFHALPSDIFTGTALTAGGVRRVRRLLCQSVYVYIYIYIYCHRTVVILKSMRVQIVRIICRLLFLLKKILPISQRKPRGFRRLHRVHSSATASPSLPRCLARSTAHGPLSDRQPPSVRRVPTSLACQPSATRAKHKRHIEDQ